MTPVDPRMMGLLLMQQQQQQQQTPRDQYNIDQMVVPPFNWPNDKNAYHGEDIAGYLNAAPLWRGNP